MSVILKWLRWFSYLFVGTALVLFAVSNSDKLAVELFPFPYVMELPKYIFILGLFILGLLTGGLLSLGTIYKWRHLARHRQKEIDSLKNELKGYRSEDTARKQTRVSEGPSPELPALTAASQ